MNFKNSLKAAVLMMCLAGTAQASVVVGGNAVIGRANTDSFNNFTIVDMNNAISASTTLTSWSVFTSDTGTLELAIFRLVGAVYNQVGISALATVTTAGLNSFATSIAVLAGDFVGVYMQTAHVQFGNIGAGGAGYSNNGSGLSNAFNGPLSRTYSISVSNNGTAVPEPTTAWLAALALGAAAFGLRSRKA